MVLKAQVQRVSQVLTGERTPAKRGIIPTAILGTGVSVALTALDTQLLGGRLTSIFSFPIPVLNINVGLIDLINGLIFFQGKTRMKSAVTAVLGSKLITGAVQIGTLIPQFGGAPGTGTSALAAGSEGAPT